jgi:hypothetical protein
MLSIPCLKDICKGICIDVFTYFAVDPKAETTS